MNLAVYGLLDLKSKTCHTLKNSCKSNAILLKKMTETVVEKQKTDDLGTIFFCWSMPQYPSRIFSHSEVHLSLDSYAPGGLVAQW